MADESEKPGHQPGSAGSRPPAALPASPGAADDGRTDASAEAAGAGAGEASAGQPWSRSSASATAAAGSAAAVTPPVRPAPASSGLGGWLIGLLVLVAIGAGGYFTRSTWMPMLGLEAAPAARAPAVAPLPGAAAPAPHAAAPAPAIPAPTVATPATPQAAGGTAGDAVASADLAAEQEQLAEAIAAVEVRVTALEQQLASLTQAVDGLTAAQEADKGLVTAITAVDERISRLERSQIQTSGLESQVRELSQKALTLREGFASLNAQVLSVSLLADAIASGSAFVRPLAGVRAVAAGDPTMMETLAGLEPHAATGIATTPALAARFPSVADAVARAATGSGGEGWSDRVVDKLLSLVTVRSTGQAAARAGGIDAVLAEAEAALAGGDLKTAADIVARIEGPAAAAAAPWLQEARLRLAADQAVATLQEQAAARLAAARG